MSRRQYEGIRGDIGQQALWIAAVVCAVGSLVFASAVWMRCGPVSEFAITCTVNPNTAAVGSLVRLPGIGPRRAEAIVEYREQWNAEGLVFRHVEDLEKIHGIGPKTVEKVRPYVRCSDRRKQTDG